MHNPTLRTTVAFAALAIATVSRGAMAEEAGIDATGKGITGGALLGGELVMAVEAAVGVQNTWAYVGGGVAGAAVGGVGGYFVEQGSDPQPAYYMLAGGLALLIPTTVAILQATSYKAPDHYLADEPGADTGPEEIPTGPQTPGTEVTVTAPEAKASPKKSTPVASRPYVPTSLVDIHDGAFQVGVPAVQVLPVYSALETKKYGVEPKTELRLPVFHATF
ncbi:MAG TPA: hypothetical protein PLJ27_08020 [Polyangiaceae bacterium]|nr:MAG: hypothetical protein BWY17_02492 [Deltaproteobacteria bacterium ADurb.Bin207]HNS98660.1 hypothetical protein [Polyangiaceae bacterium]HNZ23324.1 hypothetical protein [Polyangiaceae bacterium]HOD21906.1 hypothetical protein [Polyangiaceae bacterium]HOE49351.1 hypothetical protein [Polyangiaceae bacterium]